MWGKPFAWFTNLWKGEPPSSHFLSGLAKNKHELVRTKKWRPSRTSIKPRNSGREPSLCVMHPFRYKNHERGSPVGGYEPTLVAHSLPYLPPPYQTFVGGGHHHSCDEAFFKGLPPFFGSLLLRTHRPDPPSQTKTQLNQLTKLQAKEPDGCELSQF